jgi:hypothetical protein
VPSRADARSDRLPVSNLLAEIALRLAKAGAAAIVGLLLYLVLVGPLGNPGSVELALLCWVSGAAFVLLVESSPL